MMALEEDSQLMTSEPGDRAVLSTGGVRVEEYAKNLTVLSRARWRSEV